MIMSSKQIDLVRTALEGAKEIIDANTVLGSPIEAGNGVTIIPVSKVSVGLTTAGIDYFGKHMPAPEKNSPESIASFGGGGGTGITVTPVGFLIIKASGSVELLTADADNKPTAVSIIETVIEVLERSPEITAKLKSALDVLKKAEEVIPE